MDDNEMNLKDDTNMTEEEQKEKKNIGMIDEEKDENGTPMDDTDVDDAAAAM